MTISTCEALPNQATGEGEEEAAQHLGLGGAAALGGEEAAAALREGGVRLGFGWRGGAARVAWGAAQGCAAPLPPPLYIGGRARARAGRPPLCLPPKLESNKDSSLGSLS